jgi:hypothetical protein
MIVNILNFDKSFIFDEGMIKESFQVNCHGNYFYNTNTISS